MEMQKPSFSICLKFRYTVSGFTFSNSNRDIRSKPWGLFSRNNTRVTGTIQFFGRTLISSLIDFLLPHALARNLRVSSTSISVVGLHLNMLLREMLYLFDTYIFKQ